jgi:hypothetical protein
MHRKNENAYSISIGKYEERDQADVDVDGRIIIKWI